MSGVNKAILIGNLGRDPEIRHLENGTAVANFSIATTEIFYRKETGEKVEQTEWHNVVAWRKLAEISEQYLKKGSKVYIEGKITTRSWDDKEGNKRYTTEIIAQTMNLLDPKNNMNPSAASPSSPSSSAEQPASALEENTEDDLPF